MVTIIRTIFIKNKFVFNNARYFIANPSKIRFFYDLVKYEINLITINPKGKKN